jgi:Ribonuclease G/E
MSALETWIDGAIGETRYALAQNGRPIALVITRWSDRGKRARWSEVYVGRVRSIERALRGAFVDLGLRDEQGFLPLDKDGRAELGRGKKHAVREGEGLVVRVAREGLRGKGPVLGLVDIAQPQTAIARIARHEDDEARDNAGPASLEIRHKLDEAVEEALARQAYLPGGGVITIEPTAALTAIDVDAGARKGSADPERFARDLNLEAAAEAMRQLRLRAQGGLAAIDFVSMRANENKKAVEAALKTAAANDPWGAIFAPMSRFGVVELTRAQYMRPVKDVLLDPDGRKSVETVALEALRAIERETAHARGRKVICGLSAEVADWLEAGEIPWRPALNDRIGVRWEIEVQGASGKGASRERVDVRAV